MLDTIITLRPATQDDWPAIASLLEENELPLDGAREHLPAYLLATSRDKVIGCAAVEVYADVALLRSVAVTPRTASPRHRKTLVTGVLQEAADQQIARLYLLTVNVMDFFTQFGFRRVPIEQAPDTFNASAEFQGACPATAVFMSLTLGSKLLSPPTDE